MKTTLQITEEHIERAKETAANPEEIAKQALRMSKRIENDPALMKLAESLGTSLLQAAGMVHDHAIQHAIANGIIVRAVMEWEEIKAEADKQFEPSNGKSA